MQLIFCMETNKKTKSDYIYIRKTIERFYTYDRAQTKITPVYMNGRGNYSSRKIEIEINRLTKAYKVGTQKESVVLYCFDCDEYDRNEDDRLFLLAARKYCEDKGYKFVWFCREIESVYLGRQVKDGDKGKEAERFAKGEHIRDIAIADLRYIEYHDGGSNIANVLDEYLTYNTDIAQRE